MESLPPIELAAVASAIAYVVLAARPSAWCWPVGFVSSCLWAYRVSVAYDLYFDAALNAFYAVMSAVGLWRWTRRADGRGAAPPITRMRAREHVAWLGLGAGATAACAVLAEAYTEAAMPLVDAATTVYAVIATVLLIERRLENWLYFLAVDAVSVWLYLERGSPLFAGLFVVYCGLAAWGYASWRRQSAGGAAANPPPAAPLDSV